MRLAIIRQRYTPQGGAERFVEGALEALLERNVAITLYTREWPQTKLQLIEPHICTMTAGRHPIARFSCRHRPCTSCSHPGTCLRYDACSRRNPETTSAMPV